MTNPADHKVDEYEKQPRQRKEITPTEHQEATKTEPNYISAANRKNKEAQGSKYARQKDSATAKKQAKKRGNHFHGIANGKELVSGHLLLREVAEFERLRHVTICRGRRPRAIIFKFRNRTTRRRSAATDRQYRKFTCYGPKVGKIFVVTGPSNEESYLQSPICKARNI